jgi:hypothetical protein
MYIQQHTEAGKYELSGYAAGNYDLKTGKREI